MTLEEMVMLLDTQIVARYPDMAGNYYVSLEHAEIKERSMLISATGRGRSFQEARNDYVKEIQGKRIVINAMLKNRKEATVPEDLQ